MKRQELVRRTAENDDANDFEEANDSNDGFEMLEDCPPYLTDVGELQPETSGSQFVINSETRLDSIRVGLQFYTDTMRCPVTTMDHARPSPKVDFTMPGRKLSTRHAV